MPTCLWGPVSSHPHHASYLCLETFSSLSLHVLWFLLLVSQLRLPSVAKAAAKQTKWAAEEPRAAPTVSSEVSLQLAANCCMSPFSPSPPLQMGWEMTNIGFHYPHKNYGESIFFSSPKDWCIEKQESHHCSHCPLWSIPWELIQNKGPSQVISASDHFDTAGFPHLKSLPSSWGASWCEHLNVKAPKPEILQHLEKTSTSEQLSREKKSMRWQRKLQTHTFEAKHCVSSGQTKTTGEEQVWS
jgi:hypothetical protein